MTDSKSVDKFDDEIRNFINGEGNYTTPTSNAQKIIDYISLRLNTPIDKKTLLVFDEIQEALATITSLKDFEENHPDIRVIASGSLVRIKMKRTGKRSKTQFLI